MTAGVDLANRAKGVGKRKGRYVVCLHCERKRPHRSRGLCHTCYDNPAVRPLYPRAFDRGGERGTNVQMPLPPEPTDAPPGSGEKIRVMAERVAEGYAPCHPRDWRRGTG